MSLDLYGPNRPDRFWRLQLDSPALEQDWEDAARAVASILPAAVRKDGDRLPDLLVNCLGEGQFGPRHWELGSAKRAYYVLKPFLPRKLTRAARQLHRGGAAKDGLLEWPIERRLADFQWLLAAELLRRRGLSSAEFIYWWPGGATFALVLTHDVETQQGQKFVREVAELDKRYGFRSSFNFVPERYPIDRGLVDWLRAEGFEIGIHGLKHDGKLFSSRREFERRARRINQYLTEFGVEGFRAPLTHRQPEWMQALDIEYDLSFFDVDPYEPIAGGTMSIWPFMIGSFVELPMTLVQDYTLTEVLGHDTPELWLQKVAFLQERHGMALLNSHPDYLRSPRTWALYEQFLQAMSQRRDYWHALPGQVARWWRARLAAAGPEGLPCSAVGIIMPSNGEQRHPLPVLPPQLQPILT